MSASRAIAGGRAGRLSRRYLAAAAGVPLVGLLVLGVIGAASRPAPPVGAAVGSVAPDFALADLDGNPLLLSELRGRPVVVNFWASWCAPCVEEFPRLRAAVEAHAPSGLAVVGIVYQDRSESARSFMERMGAEWPAAMDPGGRVAAAWGIFGPPETFFLDRDGVVAARQIGPFSTESLDRHLARILEDE